MSKFFKETELACKCGRCAGKVNVGQGIDPGLYVVLDRIRDMVGRPVIVLSGYRCPEHNAEVGGVPNSQHVEGTAADITYDGVNIDSLAEIAEQCGADGIGKYHNNGFVHVDTRGYTARWEG